MRARKAIHEVTRKRPQPGSASSVFVDRFTSQRTLPKNSIREGEL